MSLCAAGRVRTDEVDGFKLDRGFQIFLTSYPEAEAALDYGSLQLQPFYAGAMVRHAGRFYRVGSGLEFQLSKGRCCSDIVLPACAGRHGGVCSARGGFPLKKRISNYSVWAAQAG